ncbi:MAG: 2OG-Fe(II) oxygenase family protein [Candidatus Sericytochromatia bacterium]
MNFINDNLDIDKIKEDFKKKSYIKIENFLNKEVAESVYQGLKDISNRGLWYQANHGNPKFYNPDLPFHESNVFHYSFRYEMYPLKNYTIDGMMKNNISRRDIDKLDKILKNPEMELKYNHILREIGDFLNSDFMHDLISSITDNPLTKNEILCFASRFTQDDFLASHNDSTYDMSSPRRVAFVLNMTKDWLIHWGGNLVILDNHEDKILEAFLPLFNNLFLFNVPLRHAVLPVSCYCQSERFAITGWYQNKYDNNYH